MNTMTKLMEELSLIHILTGAGDTVISVLATALADGRSFEESCYLANVAAGIVVGLSLIHI